MKLQRVDAPPITPVILKAIWSRTPPERLASRLPPPGCRQLSVQVDAALGFGRCGSVFSVTTSPLDAPENSYVPNLVIKVAQPNERHRLASEAAIYEELESLQGIAVPLCFGWFEMELTDGDTVLQFDKNKRYQEAISISELPWKPRATTDRKLSILVLERLGAELPFEFSKSDR